MGLYNTGVQVSDPKRRSMKRLGIRTTGDQRAALQNLLNKGYSLDGGGRTYKLSDAVNIPSGVTVSDVTFEYIGSDFGALTVVIDGQTYTVRGLLYVGAASKVVLEDVVIKRGTDRTKGIATTSAGVHLNEANGVTIRGLDVSGDGKGAGVLIEKSTNVKMSDFDIHDMTWEDNAATDDMLAGISISDTCANITIRDGRVRNLLGYRAGGFPVQFGSPQTLARWSRGIEAGNFSNENIRITNVTLDNVDQGYDCFGPGITFNNCVARDCLTFGFKQANSFERSAFFGCLAIRCGYIGFVFNISNVAFVGRLLELHGCRAIDCGTSDCTGSPARTTNVVAAPWASPPPSGFGINGVTGKQVEAIRVAGGSAEDSYGRMVYGFGCFDDSEDVYVDPAFVSRGHTGAAVFGVGVREFGDADFMVPSVPKRYALRTALTAPRQVYLPLASSVREGAVFVIADEIGTVSGTNTLLIRHSGAGSDLINGANSHLLTTPYETRTLVSDGVSRWTMS
jgi:hypothetical protein